MDRLTTHETKQPRYGDYDADARQNRTAEESVVHGAAQRVLVRPLNGPDSVLDLAAVMKGEETILNTPSLLKGSANATCLPLSNEELDQLQEILQTLPMIVHTFTLMDVLGFKTYCELNTLHQAAIADHNSTLQCVFKNVKNQFCQYWVNGFDEQTPVDRILFQENIGKLSTFLEKNSQTPHPQHYDEHYQNALTSIGLLLKLWASDDGPRLLTVRYCYAFKRLAMPVPQEKPNPTEYYQGVQAFIDFVICVFENSKAIRAQETDDFTPFLRQTKTLYDCITPAPTPLATAEHQLENEKLVEFEKARNLLLTTLFRAAKRVQLRKKDCAKRAAKQKQIATPTIQTLKAWLLDEKTLTMEVLYGRYLNGAIGFFLEEYAHLVIPTHVTINACLIRTETLNQIFCSSVFHAIPSCSFKKPEMAFLSSEQQADFSKLLSSIGQDIDQLFVVNDTLARYAKKTEQSATIRHDTGILLEYHSIYPEICRVADTVYPAVIELQKKHSQKCIEFITQLPIETCLAHQTEIHELFDELFLKAMHKFSVLAHLKHNIEALLPETCPEPTYFLDTPIASYLMMEEIEQAFLEKITPGVSEPEMPTQTTLPTAKKEVSPAVMSALKIRMGEKLKSIIEKLNNLELYEVHTKRHTTGSHITFATRWGFKVTVPMHGMNEQISPGVAHSLMNSVNNVMPHRRASLGDENKRI